MKVSEREDAVAYLLDELAGSERRAFEARLAAEPSLRIEVDALRPVVGRLERMDPAAWDAPDPPPPPSTPESRTERARRPRAQKGLVLPAWGMAAGAGALLVLVLAFAGGVLVGQGGDEAPSAPGGRAIALEPVDGVRGASGRVRLSRDEAVVRVRGLAPATAGDFYEVWLLSSPTDLVSLGSFRVSASGDANLRVTVPVDPLKFRYVDVSLEPGDGDPAHSQRSVLRAPTRS